MAWNRHYCRILLRVVCVLFIFAHNARADDGLGALDSAANLAEEMLTQPPAEVDKKKPAPEIRVHDRFGVVSQWAYAFHKRDIRNYLVSLIDKLAMSGDPTQLQLRIRSVPLPWGGLNSVELSDQGLRRYESNSTKSDNLGPPFEFYLGLLAFVKNEDELAALLAHGLSEINKEQFAANDQEVNRQIDEIVSSLKGSREEGDKFREAVRADLGTVERLIQHGYNPWALHDIYQRISNVLGNSEDSALMKWINFWVFGTRYSNLKKAPIEELRMSAIRLYILNQGKNHKDLSQITEEYKSLPKNLQALRWRAKVLSFPFMSGKFVRALSTLSLQGYGLYRLCIEFGWIPGRSFHEIFWAHTTNFWDLDTGKFLANGLWSLAKLPFRILYWLLKPSSSDKLIALIRNTEFYKTRMEFVGRVKSILPARLKLNSHPTEEPSAEEKLKIAKQLLSSSLQESSFDAGFGYELSVLKRVARPRILKAFKLIREVMEPLSQGERERVFASLTPDLKFSDLLFSEDYARLGLLELWKLAGGKPKDSDFFSQSFESEKQYSPLKIPSFMEQPEYRFSDLQPLMITLDTLENLGEAPAWKKLRVMERISSLRLGTDAFGEELFNRLAPELFTFAFALDQPGAKLLSRGSKGEIERVRQAIHYYESRKLWHDAKYYPLFGRQRLLMSPRVPLIRILATQGHLRKFEEFYRWNSGVMCPLEIGWCGADWDLSFSRAAPKVSDPFARLGLLAFSLGIDRPKYNVFDRIKIGTDWNSATSKWAQDFIESRVRSISELKALVETEMLSRGIKVENLASIFYFLIVKHPEWMKTSADVKALLGAPYFWPKWGSLGDSATPAEKMLIEEMKRMRNKGQSATFWEIDPGAAEVLHARILRFQKEHKMYKEDFAGQEALWLDLSSRGVTATTDTLFEKLYNEAPPEKKDQLGEEALKGRIWDQLLKVELERRRLKSNADLAQLKASSDPGTRLLLLGNVLRGIDSSLPERGLGYRQILEDLSNEIVSSPEESKVIQDHKKGGSNASSSAQDFGVQVLSTVLNDVLGWKKDQQWNFILFLRGEVETDDFIRSKFPAVGPERVRRMFQILPVAARVVVVDGFLSSSRGLLPRCDPKSKEAQKIIDHLLRGGSETSREIGKQIIEAFLYSLQGGNKNTRNYALAYLLSTLNTEEKNSTGRTLKNVLEVFGAMGVKIGQILAATEILPKAESDFLFDLQEKADIPDREFVYEDLRNILGRETLPYDLLNLLGSASLKYAIKARDPASKSELALKVLRASAEIHTPAEFKQLKRMADYLVENYGPRYGVLRAIISAAQKAVEREKQLDHETEMSALAARTVYAKSPLLEVKLEVPEEIWMHRRLIASQFAEGESFRDLPEALKSFAAKGILSIETPNLFQGLEDFGEGALGPNGEIVYDPDRHAGNYRIRLLEDGRLSIKPIDFGQVLTITKTEREQVLDLFALSHIAKNTRSTLWAAQKVADILGLHEKGAAKRIYEKMNIYFTDDFSKTESDVAPYYNLLAALHDAGFERDINFFDFIRAIMTLGQYRESLPKEDRARLNPKIVLKRIVTKRADVMLSEMKTKIAVSDGYRGRVILKELNKREANARSADAPPCVDTAKKLGGRRR